MEKDKLFKIAYDFLNKENLCGLYLAYDIGNRIVCFGGNPNNPYYGCRSVGVDKNTGNCEWFIVEADEGNEKILDESVEIDIPQEYVFMRQ